MVLCREHGFRRYAIADELRAALLEANPLVHIGSNATPQPLRALIACVGWDTAKRSVSTGPQVRWLMQDFGTRARERLGHNVWLDAVITRMTADGVLGSTPVVVSDIRLPVEARWVRLVGGVIVRVKRTGLGPANSHVTEYPMPEYLIDAELLNDGPLYGPRRDCGPSLPARVRALVESGALNSRLHPGQPPGVSSTA